ncbi:hypothetical protein CHS0354_024151 [Potamilus streckersoni]|uniref:ditrans,polycis-polyprenyl diphosphate synthase [(2E,6E)-farnesyldiphosphate specific] n=1 Tax=Potamilus streckersoni TaxID=2493646 RepID=A0AAE0RZM9_9BIVA|nr:hypothetical protein CHS0354_024151 [Potamilus streckersoni]
MFRIFIDGKGYSAVEGQTIIQVADAKKNDLDKGTYAMHHIKTLGVQVEIPRFCYHESLSVAGNCRMCLVEYGMPKVDPVTKKYVLDEKGDPVIQWMPKLTTACSTKVIDEMRVKTHVTSPLVKDAQRGILEFILINHPLDCPTCDQAGECPLQQITYKYGPESSRFEFEKVHKPKREKWGSKIVFDAERCINCTRCVRFFDEYTGTHDLEIVQRGWNNYPSPASGKSLDENPYSMNVIDLCPVGALTSADYRFKSRVWEMSGTETISLNNGKCSNITMWVRDNLVMRFTPRFNPLVNGHFIADEDRLNYKWINENRASAPKLRNVNQFVERTWEEAICEAATILKSYSPSEIFFLGSTMSSLETMYALKKLAEKLGVLNIDYATYRNNLFDNKLISSDATPNRLGAELVDLSSNRVVSVFSLSEDIQKGKIKCVLAVEDDLLNILNYEVLERLESYIVLPHHNLKSNQMAKVVLPAATFAEMVGSFINVDGVIQLTRPAKVLKFQNRELMWELVSSRLDIHGTKFDKWVREENLIDAKPAWEILCGMLTALSKEKSFNSARDIFEKICAEIPDLSHLNYKKIGGKIVLIVTIVVGLLITVAYTVLAERWIAAAIQRRIGPNRVGWHGVLQPFADLLKLLFKENIKPKEANKFYHTIAPMISLVAAFSSIAVIPFSSSILIADVPVGVLFVLAVTSVGVYGITLSGWASGSTYSSLGGLRSSAQMVSYEIAMGLAVVSVVVISGSMSMHDIVKHQTTNPLHWNIVQNFFGFVIFLISAFAETNRAPFDLPEAEQELKDPKPKLVEKQKQKVPCHVAIIMDGNGRWAKKQNLPRLAGHYQGVKIVRDVVETAIELGISYLTLFAFSTENWKRPKEEVFGIMNLTIDVVKRETEDLVKNGVRILIIGDINTLPSDTKQALTECVEKTKLNTRLMLVLALNYGSRWEITQAVKTIIKGIHEEKWTLEDIDETMIQNNLSTKNIPDPDLLIRTGGGFRVSNFLLWQIAYTELIVLDVLWPDFNRTCFNEAIREFQQRERRYGMISEQLEYPEN